MRIGRLAWLFFKVGSLNELQYRANFFIQLLQSAVSVGVALVVLALVYSQTTELNGWNESELMIVLGIQILLGGVIRTTIQPNMQRLMEDVRDGKLDFALTKPEDSQVLVSIRNVQIWRAVDVIAGAAVLAYGAWSLGNLVYDNREAIGDFFQSVGGHIADGASAAWNATTGAVSDATEWAGDRLEDAGDAVADVGKGALHVVSLGFL